MDCGEVNSENLNSTFVTKLQETFFDEDLNQINNYDVQTRLYNIRNITKMLIEKAKWIEERRKYLETNNWHLKNEIADIAKRYIQSQDEIKTLNKQLDKFEIESLNTSRTVDTPIMLTNNSRRPKLDKAVSCHMFLNCNLKKSSESRSTQTQPNLESKSTALLFHGAQKNEMILSSTHGNEPVIVMSKKELRRLDSNMESLRLKLEMKEETWAKTAEREREQRLKLLKINSEMMSLQKVIQCRTQDLSVKTRDLKMTRTQLDHAEREIKQLKKIILKTNLASRSNIAPQVSWSIAAFEQCSLMDGNFSEPSKKKKIYSKKIKKVKDELDSKQSNISCMIEKTESVMSLTTTSKESYYVTLGKPVKTVKFTRKSQDDKLDTEGYILPTKPLTTGNERRGPREDMTLSRLLQIESDTLIKSCHPL